MLDSVCIPACLPSTTDPSPRSLALAPVHADAQLGAGGQVDRAQRAARAVQKPLGADEAVLPAQHHPSGPKAFLGVQFDDLGRAEEVDPEVVRVGLPYERAAVAHGFSLSMSGCVGTTVQSVFMADDQDRYTYVVGITLRHEGQIVKEGSMPFTLAVPPEEMSLASLADPLARLLSFMAAHEKEGLPLPSWPGERRANLTSDELALIRELVESDVEALLEEHRRHKGGDGPW